MKRLHDLDSDLLIGTGGWQYFLVPGDRLINYSKCFRFVEVNSSFYSYPTLRDAYSWRKKVPDDFIFAVRANRDITHRYKMLICDETIKAQTYMKSLCDILRSQALVYTTPPTFEPNRENLARAIKFFTEAERGRFELVWETRGSSWRSSKNRETLRRILKELDLVHSVDLTYMEPAYEKELIYSRIFGQTKETTGHNQYRMREDQLGKVVSKVGKYLQQKKRVMVAFHTVRMYEDAARMIRMTRKNSNELEMQKTKY
ncbi:MAG: DUF72 domain-containing protein [Thermoproteota archaeon]